MLMPMIGTMDAAAVSDESTSYFPSVVHFVNMSPKAVGIGRGSFADPSVTPDDVTSICCTSEYLTRLSVPSPVPFRPTLPFNHNICRATA